MRLQVFMRSGFPALAARAISGAGDQDLNVTATGATSQANSYGIKATQTVVTGGGANTGVRAPANAEPGDEFEIVNFKGSTLLVYPPGTDKINNGAASASVNLADATRGWLKLITPGNWVFNT